MARTGTDSKSQTARQRARQAMADELEQARQRETKLAAVFTAIDAMEQAETALGKALTELRELGVTQSELAARTSLSTREVSSAIRLAKNTQSNSSEDAGKSADADGSTNEIAGDSGGDDEHTH